MDSELIQLIVPLVLGGGAIGWLMPSNRKKPRVVGAVLGLVAIFLLIGRMWGTSGNVETDVMFDLFAGITLASAGMMITDKNPAYSALWFALVTLSVCGLFFVQSAPFLAAASVIVYAGAIIVTFMFVLMLASQSGSGGYDQRPQHPLLATVTAMLLLGCVLVALHAWGPDRLAANKAVAAEGKTNSDTTEVKVVAKAVSNPLSQPTSKELGTLHQLGRSLFGDYLFAVELAGTLLLVASIGAIAIAPRRSQGTL